MYFDDYLKEFNKACDELREFIDGIVEEALTECGLSVDDNDYNFVRDMCRFYACYLIGVKFIEKLKVLEGD